MNTKRDKIAAIIGVIVTAFVVGYLQLWPMLNWVVEDIAN